MQNSKIACLRTTLVDIVYYLLHTEMQHLWYQRWLIFTFMTLPQTSGWKLQFSETHPRLSSVNQYWRTWCFGWCIS